MGIARARASVAGLMGVVVAISGGVGSGVALSGCGASESLNPIAKAAEVTSHQAGVRFTLSVKLSSSALSGQVAISANGYFDEQRHDGAITMNLANIPGVSSLPGATEGNQSAEMLIVGSVIYMKMPFLAAELPAGKAWMKIDVSKAAKALGISEMSSLNDTNPSEFLEFLRASPATVTTIGAEQLEGARVTHYVTTLQLSRIVEELPSAQQKAAKTALEQLGMTNAIPVDVWVDTGGRVRRMEMSFGGKVPASTPTAGGSVSGTVTIDFTKYGPVPQVVAPPEGEVFDASSLPGALTQGG